jgi:hypothetical protein
MRTPTFLNDPATQNSYGLPTCFCHSRNEPLVCDLSQHKPRDHKLTEVPSWTTSYLTTISDSTLSSVTRQVLQFSARSVSLFWRIRRVKRFLFQLLANRRLVRGHCASFCISIQHAFLCHKLSLSLKVVEPLETANNDILSRFVKRIGQKNSFWHRKELIDRTA